MVNSTVPVSTGTCTRTAVVCSTNSPIIISDMYGTAIWEASACTNLQHTGNLYRMSSTPVFLGPHLQTARAHVPALRNATRTTIEPSWSTRRPRAAHAVIAATPAGPRRRADLEEGVAGLVAEPHRARVEVHGDLGPARGTGLAHPALQLPVLREPPRGSACGPPQKPHSRGSVSWDCPLRLCPLSQLTSAALKIGPFGDGADRGEPPPAFSSPAEWPRP